METQAQRIQRQRKKAYLDGIKNAGLLSGEHRETTPGEAEEFLNRPFPVNTSEQPFGGLLSDWDMLTEEEKWKQIDDELYTGPKTYRDIPAYELEGPETWNPHRSIMEERRIYDLPGSQMEAYNTANLQMPEADWYKAENVNTIPNRITGVHNQHQIHTGDTRPSNLTGGLTGSPEGIGELIAQRKAQELIAQRKAQEAQQQPPSQGLLDTNMGEGVGGKYTDEPRFRRRNPFAEYLMNIGASPVFQGQSDWSEVN